jgi:glycosyltransferase involved in cell wall biosynthesis
MFGRARTVLFNSGPEQELAGELMGAAAARGPVVGMGMDPFDADPSACPRARALGRPYAIYSGRREEAKGTPLLLEYLDAFRRRTGRDLALVLTGSGPVAPPAALAPHVLDLGFVSEEEKHAAMAGAVAFVHPSVYESLGIVLLESFLAGTPALVHARGRVLRWQCARSGGGLWFVGYPDFEEALCALLDRPGLRAALGAQGRRYVLAEYAWKAVEDRLLAALRAG